MQWNWLKRLASLPLDNHENHNERRYLWPALNELYKRFMRHDVMKTAASLTYTTLFAVVPLTAVVYSILSAVPEFQGAGDQAQQFLFDQFVPATGEVVREQLNNFSSQARNLTLVGVGFLFVTAVMMMVSVESAFNSIWQTTGNRKGVAGFLRYWAILTLGPILIGAGFALSSYATSLSMVSSAVEGVGYERLLHLLSPLFSFLALLFVYMVIPNTRVRLAYAAIGAAVTALLIELAKFGFSLYVANFPSYQLIYGAFAAVPLFLLWIYVTWLIVLLGAEIISWLGETRSGEYARQPPLWQALQVLAWLYHSQRKGELVATADIKERLGGNAQSVLTPLIENGWLVESDEQQWVLARSMETLPLWQLIDQLPWRVPEEEAPASLARYVDIDILNRALEESRRQRRSMLATPVARLFDQHEEEAP
ncbi:YihY family inner membrane protein [Carnimonas nigrificans]|uniref:YihY family inner membrane protein n=1 Tax=Carnimonas nigrificans TaxID=64323 RepID=UPI000472587B|nr:YihY family inner membrane protein [Carnimonas nigrificans]